MVWTPKAAQAKRSSNRAATKISSFLLCLCFFIGIQNRVTVADAFVAPSQTMAVTKRHNARASAGGGVKNTLSASNKAPFNAAATKLASSPTDAVPGIGEEGCKLPSPSGVNMTDGTSQIAIFVGIFVALGICSSICNAGLAALTTNFEWFQSFRYSWPIAIGAVYTLAGVTHFLVADDYKNIFPYPNAWGGLWKLPGSASFHVAWTGVAEFAGGVGLLVGGLIDWLAPVYFSSPNIVTSAGLASDCAAALYLLTWAVTPANIFMFTHGAKLPMNVEEPVPISFHIVRFAMQVLLLGLLYQMGAGTFDALL